MKKLLVLPGGSIRNRTWGEACVEFFRDQFDETHFIQYDHWETGESNINFTAEIAKIVATVEATETEGEWFVFAKSIGSVLALKAVAAGVINPIKCVFFGMPLNLVADTEFKDDWSLLETLKIQTLAFHNDADPTANYAFTKEALDLHAPQIYLVTLSDHTHDYLTFKDYQADINQFLTS